jgi:hypothetical protein
LNDDEDAMEGGHGLHNENLYDDDGVIQRHAQGNTMSFISHVTNPASINTPLHRACLCIKLI